jgi:hypothetical protein
MGCGASIQTQDQTKAHTAQCFVVACMDFRLVDDTVYYLNTLGLSNNYDVRSCWIEPWFHSR